MEGHSFEPKEIIVLVDWLKEEDLIIKVLGSVLSVWIAHDQPFHE